MGLRVYSNPRFRERVDSALRRRGGVAPDYFIVNDAGLHTGAWMRGSGGVDEVVATTGDALVPFWLSHLALRDVNTTRGIPLLFRNNVCPAGTDRTHAGNVQSLDAINALTAEGLGRAASAQHVTVGFADWYDMTYAFHWDNEFSDGGHYGRPPWYYTAGHAARHFVDDMLVQVYLNFMCKE